MKMNLGLQWRNQSFKIYSTSVPPLMSSLLPNCTPEFNYGLGLEQLLSMFKGKFAGCRETTSFWPDTERDLAWLLEGVWEVDFIGTGLFIFPLHVSIVSIMYKTNQNRKPVSSSNYKNMHVHVHTCTKSTCENIHDKKNSCQHFTVTTRLLMVIKPSKGK